MKNFVVLYGREPKKDGTLHEDAADRCRKAVEVANGHPDSVIIFSVDSEYKGIYSITIDYLRRLGWPPERMILKQLARNTLEETLTARTILRNYGATSVTVVSSRYHMPRIRFIWKRLGFPGQVHECESTLNASPLFAKIWELLGWGKILLQSTFSWKILPF